jgi:hypothetical protein
MSLETLYTSAAANTYVGQVRTKQEEAVGAGAGVNFMDGTRRNRNNDQSDEFQTEFTRNTAGTYVAGGAQAPALASPTQNNTDFGAKTNTRWTNKAAKLAFGNEGPAQLSKGFYGTPTTFRVSKVGTDVADIHNYVPTANTNLTGQGGYINTNPYANIRRNSTSTSTTRIG